MRWDTGGGLLGILVLAGLIFAAIGALTSPPVSNEPPAVEHTYNTAGHNR